MRKDEIEETLSKCTNLVELIGKASELKRLGEKETVVNGVVTKLRKRMMKAGSKVKTLNKEEIFELKKEPVGEIPFHVDSINRPLIVYDGVNVLM